MILYLTLKDVYIRLKNAGYKTECTMRSLCIHILIKISIQALKKSEKTKKLTVVKLWELFSPYTFRINEKIQNKQYITSTIKEKSCI